MPTHFRPLLLLLPLLLLAACGLLSDTGGETAATPTVAVPTPANTPPPEETEGPETPPTTASSVLTLTVWTMPDIAPDDELAGGPILREQMVAYDAAHPDVNLVVDAKTVTDQGGALNYLRTGRDIAPDILPDLILLPTDQLFGASAEGLIFPIEGLAQEMIDDLFPVANALARVDGVLYGYPYTLNNLQHAVFDTAVFTNTLPSTWSAFVESGGTFVFPADGPKGAELALAFYLADDGRLLTEANQPQLEIDPLTQALTQLGQARDAGVIAPQSSNLISLEGAWQSFQSAEANVAQTTAAQYLSKRALGFEGRFAPLPGPAGPLPARLNGRVWSITTADPVKQALALELINWLTAPDNLGQWSAESLFLPARQAAFDAWPADDPYVAFLQNELNRALPFPRAADATLMGALGTAVSDVVSLAKSAPAAATEAATAVNP